MRANSECEEKIEKICKIIQQISEARGKQFDLGYALGAKHALAWVIRMGSQDIENLCTPNYLVEKPLDSLENLCNNLEK